MGKARLREDYEVTKDIYDGLIKLGVREPAVFKMANRHIIGAWEELNVVENGWVLKSGKKAVRVYGDAASWKDAIDQAGRYLQPIAPSGVKTLPTSPSQPSAEPAVFVSGISV
jgi:hypothetical protein